MSPRKRLDDAYRAFLELFAAQIATAVAEAEAYEHERRRAEALAELDRAKTAFFSNVSHEFRTPLTLMLGPLEDALAARSAAARRARASSSSSTATRCAFSSSSTPSSISPASRRDASRPATSPPTSPRFTADLASVFRSAIEHAGLAFAVDCPPLAEPVYVDRDMWEKIVLNLLSNALKFTFEGAIAVSPPPGRRAPSSSPCADTGIGIRRSEVPHSSIASTASRARAARTHEGSGIGLALVQELVRLHGGAVRVESVVGEGSSFTVAIPCGCGASSRDRVSARGGGLRRRRSAPRVRTSTRRSAGCPHGRRVRRLRREPSTGDAPAHLSWPTTTRTCATTSVACSARYDVEAVADGRGRARRRRAPELPDLVLSDVMMPGSTASLLRGSASRPRHRALPVILLSARAGEEARVEGLRPAPTTISSSPSARASCSPASPPT